MLTEASTAALQLQGFPRAAQLVRLLHKGYNMPDNMDWRPSSLDKRDIYPAGDYRKYTLIGGSSGVAAVQKLPPIQAGSGLNLIWMTEDGQTFQETIRWEDWIGSIQTVQNDIGEFRKIVAAEMSIDQARKRIARSSRREDDKELDMEDMLHYLFMRAKPFWLRMMTAAYEDVKGVTATLIKHDALDRASSKLEQLHKMHDLILLILDLQHPEMAFVPGTLESILRRSCFLTAQHIWPEPYRRNNVAIIYKAVKSGRMDVLSTLINYTKREMLSRNYY